MRLVYLLGGAALTLTSAWAIAQDAPESLLPQMFQDPAPTPSPASRPSAAPSAGSGAASRPPAAASTSSPVVQALPGQTTGAGGNVMPGAATDGPGLTRLPSLEELAKMTPEDFEKLIGRKVEFDMPPQARRSMDRAGLLAESEGGLPASSIAGENGALIRVALERNRGALVSRWGHIALRRALVSRLEAPQGMSPQDFLALRVELLTRMGEFDAARAILQDIDIADYNPALGDAAFSTYSGTADFTGLCPVLATQGSLRDDTPWNVSKSICEAFRGNSNAALSQLDRFMSKGALPKIDLLLAQKYAGAAGKARRAVTIEWDGVPSLTPWRYGMAIAVGLEPPAKLIGDGGPYYDYATALAPMVGLERRAAAADVAGAAGVLSNAAMVDLYAQVYADGDIAGDWQERAEHLRDAYTNEAAADRLEAMQALWDGASNPSARYARKVLTAAAAARIAPSSDLADNAGAIIGSMLAAGFDANAVRWSSVVDKGSEGWAMLVLAAPGRGQTADAGDIDRFVDNDESADKRRSAFLVAGLAGLGRIEQGQVQRYSNDMSLGLDGATRWTEAIDAAAARGDTAGVVILAGFGMQGHGWQRMTPRYLFHIVSALGKVGLAAEARMIAAEAIVRT